MTFSELASIGSFVGGISVLITLVYLTLQVRQSAEANRFSANVALHGILNDLSPQFFSSSENSAIFLKGMSSFISLTPQEKQLFTVFMYMLFSHFEMVLVGPRRRKVDADLLHRTNYVLAYYYRTPGVRQWWNGTSEIPGIRAGFSEAFRAYVEKGAHEDELKGAGDMSSAIAKELAGAPSTASFPESHPSDRSPN